MLSNRPATRKPASKHLEREINENYESQIFLGETFLNKLEIRHSVIRLEADLGNEVNDAESLDI